jgi:butyryl-CoA dehydrogenase
MNLELSDEQRLLQQTVRDFTESEVKPLARELDETGPSPRQNLVIASWLLQGS